MEVTLDGEKWLPGHFFVQQSRGRFVVSAVNRIEEPPHDLHVLLRHLLPQPHGLEGFGWLPEPLEAHRLPVADRPNRAVPTLDLNAACAPASPHGRYHHDAVTGIDELLNVYPEISDCVVELR